MKKTDEKESDFQILQEMTDGHLAGPEIYHASKFWNKLNKLNTSWLKKDGLENFKRTVNNNYFNWMVHTRSVYFRKVARHFFAKAKRAPVKLISALTINVDEMHHRTYVSTNTEATFFQRKIYALYLLFLHEYVRDHDNLKIFQDLQEPMLGNPIVVSRKNKKISQDISSSYMEYLYVRNSLGKKFSNIKTVAEVGGGYGRLTYLYHLLHQSEGIKIVLIDLPPALFVAQWYLRAVFPDAKIMIYRDFSAFSEIEDEFKASSICFLLPHQLELLPERTIDLLINVSSLQEMSRRQINHYYELVDKKTRYFYTKQWSLWENQEDNLSVPAVIYPTRPDWKLINARTNPVHTDFFEAIFEVR